MNEKSEQTDRPVIVKDRKTKATERKGKAAK